MHNPCVSYSTLVNKLLPCPIAADQIEHPAVDLIRHTPIDEGTTGAVRFWTRHGQPWMVRRVAHTDHVGIGDLLQRVGDRSYELRYLLSRPRTDQIVRDEAQRIMGGRTQDHMTLISAIEEDGANAIVAVAEVIRDAAAPTSGEFALLVRDDMQRVGIGSALARLLAQIASVAGIRALRAHVRPDNRAMRAVIRKLGLPYTAALRYGDLHFVIQLPAPDDPPT